MCPWGLTAGVESGRIRSARMYALLLSFPRVPVPRFRAVVLWAALAASLPPLAFSGERAADLVLTHGKAATLDPTRPAAEAVAVVGDRILAVGTSAEIGRFVGPKTEVVELSGRLLIPAFVEGHGHLLGLGESKRILDLTPARSWDDILARVGNAARKAPPGAWIVGRGWHQEKWDRTPEPNVEGIPLHASLDAVSPQNPVLLIHASTHASFGNARALKLAGVTRDTKNPDGGEIVRDESGEPTGFLRERAQLLLTRARESALDNTPSAAEERFSELVRLAGEEALSKGVTTFHDAGSDFATIDRFKTLAERGELPLRLYVMVRGESNETLETRLDAYRLVGYAHEFLTVRSIKRMMDGALGSHGAWLLEPYADLPSSTGTVLDPPEIIRQTAEIAIRGGFQLNVHAIGDRANRETLDVYEATFARHGGGRDLRWRIEHAQHLSLTDIPRFGKLGVIASMQAVHATSDGPWVEKRLGADRTQTGAFVWRSLLDSGAVVTNGTDVPTEDLDPIANFYSAVSRRMKDGQAFHPEQRMTREEALRATTLENAYAAFEEKGKGSIEAGKLADLVVLSKDILTIPEDEIPLARVDLTILGGRVKYRREDRARSFSPAGTSRSRAVRP